MDTGAAAVTLVAGVIFFMLRPDARTVAGPMLLPAAAGICAGLLGVVLAAMAIVTAFLTRSFVAAIGNMDEALMPFRTTAVVAGAGLVASLAGLVALEAVVGWVDAVLLAVAGALTVWTTVGVVQLVGIIVFFAQVRAREMHTLMDAESAREERIRKEDARR